MLCFVRGNVEEWNGMSFAENNARVHRQSDLWYRFEDMEEFNCEKWLNGHFLTFIKEISFYQNEKKSYPNKIHNTSQGYGQVKQYEIKS